MTPILGPSSSSPAAARAWAADRGAPGWYVDLADLYWSVFAELGVRPEVGWAQAAHETGLGRFGRAVTRAHNNYCGLKVRVPGADDDPESHARFPTPRAGIEAHRDHLALYAGHPGAPFEVTHDPRHFEWLHGRARTVEDLSGSWAPSSTYAKAILRNLQEMGTGYWLLDHPNPNGDHFYRSRREPLLAFVVHITAGLEDLDGVDDQSAERTARYADSTERRVSWHSGSDSDSALDLLPAEFTAFHVRGYNSCTYGHEISKADPNWSKLTEAERDRLLIRAARHLAPRARAAGVPFRKATRGELDRVRARGGSPVGFIGHWELDPERRSDPGRVGSRDTFPWELFLRYLNDNDLEVDEMSMRAIWRIENAYRRWRKDPHAPDKDPGGMQYWDGRVDAVGGDQALRECEGALAHEAGF